MSEWRRIAIEFIPELTKEISLAINKTELWDELRSAFIEASKSRDIQVCRAIVKYFRWCVSDTREPLPNEVQTAAVITFLEKMVRSPDLIDLLIKWLSKEEVLHYSSHVVYSAGESAVEYIRRHKGGDQLS
ncbi:MAG: hypothetical protein JWN70_4570 [Planctomycetaceae bacterium]|nr:hypothetical protein [Planctomycetaceae bacterium]